MIQKFKVINDRLLVDATFEVDTEIFTEEMAKILLDENDKFWDENNSPIFELLIKYTIRMLALCLNKDRFF